MNTSPTLQKVAEHAATVKEARAILTKELTRLRAAITTADQAGDGRNDIVRAADGGLSRPLVYKHLGALDILGLARKALGELLDPDPYGFEVTVQERGGMVRLDILEGGRVGPSRRDWEEDPEGAAENERYRVRAALITLNNLIGGIRHELRQVGLNLQTEADPVKTGDLMVLDGVITKLGD